LRCGENRFRRDVAKLFLLTGSPVASPAFRAGFFAFYALRNVFTDPHAIQ
jgi:hypothetical protein